MIAWYVSLNSYLPTVYPFSALRAAFLTAIWQAAHRALPLGCCNDWGQLCHELLKFLYGGRLPTCCCQPGALQKGFRLSPWNIVFKPWRWSSGGEVEYQWALTMVAAPLFTFCHIHLAGRHNFAGSTLCDITFLYSHFPDLTLAWWHEYNFQLAFSVPGMIFVFLTSIASACQEAVSAANTIHPNPGL